MIPELERILFRSPASDPDQLANTIVAGGTTAHVVTSSTAGSPIYRVVLGPYPTRDEAIKVARASKREYWVYEGSP